MKRHIGTASLAFFVLAGAPSSAEDAAALPHFARAAKPYDVSLQALAIATLRIDGDNCLRHGNSVVLWHHDTVAEYAEDGRIRIVDGFTGNVVHVGEEVAMAGGGGGGSGIATWSGIATAKPAPPDACTGTFWSGGPVSTAQETVDLKQRLLDRKPVPHPDAGPPRKE